MGTLLQDPGETDLGTLLGTLKTTLHQSTYVFVTVRDGNEAPPLSQIQLLFREAEGVTIITTIECATQMGLGYFFPSKMITLNVTSSLEAVGFMAVIATKLAERGISVNPVSGFYHDHIFVPLGKEMDALHILEELANEHA